MTGIQNNLASAFDSSMKSFMDSSIESKSTELILATEDNLESDVLFNGDGTVKKTAPQHPKPNVTTTIDPPPPEPTDPYHPDTNERKFSSVSSDNGEFSLILVSSVCGGCALIIILAVFIIKRLNKK